MADKFCKDCQHRRTAETISFYTIPCHAPQNIKRDRETGEPVINLVIGGYRYQYDYCYAARISEIAGCGAEGRWFEPKGTVPQRHEMPAVKSKAITLDDL